MPPLFLEANSPFAPGYIKELLESQFVALDPIFGTITRAFAVYAKPEDLQYIPGLPQLNDRHPYNDNFVVSRCEVVERTSHELITVRVTYRAANKFQGISTQVQQAAIVVPYWYRAKVAAAGQVAAGLSADSWILNQILNPQSYQANMQIEFTLKAGTDYGLNQIELVARQIGKVHLFNNGDFNSTMGVQTWQYVGAQTRTEGNQIIHITHAWIKDGGTKVPPRPVGMTESDVVLPPDRPPYAFYVPRSSQAYREPPTITYGFPFTPEQNEIDNPNRQGWRSLPGIGA